MIHLSLTRQSSLSESIRGLKPTATFVTSLRDCNQMIFIFYILTVLLIFLSYKSFRGGIDYLNYFKSELAKPPSNFTPFASIIAPCKGLDEGLGENLAALLEQDYPEYEVIFVVDDENDPAVAVIEGLMNRRDAETRRNKGSDSVSPRLCGEKARVAIAPKTIDSSQKVENLREAVLRVSNESAVLVFVDSDARPTKDWLRRLIAPLADENIGSTTGYRWFISPRPNFASEMRSAWNASIASALGPNRKGNFCWGGSTAIRRETFDKLNIRDKWQGVLSDDFALTKAVKVAGLDIHFVPHALIASVESCTFREMLEFTTRQMKITRVYAPHLWKLSLFGSSLFTVVMLAAFAIAIFSKQNDFRVIAAIVTIILVSFFSIGKSWLRLNAASLVLNQYSHDLRKQFLPQNTFWLLTPPLFFYNSLAALFSRRMTWRGLRYELVSPNETRRLP
jgi:cellulose synthase/poly-beta-1,6-N-acetylglucosamine synthase-like glycosyltransferase